MFDPFRNVNCCFHLNAHHANLYAYVNRGKRGKQLKLKTCKNNAPNIHFMWLTKIGLPHLDLHPLVCNGHCFSIYEFSPDPPPKKKGRLWPRRPATGYRGGGIGFLYGGFSVKLLSEGENVSWKNLQAKSSNTHVILI